MSGKCCSVELSSKHFICILLKILHLFVCVCGGGMYMGKFMS